MDTHNLFLLKMPFNHAKKAVLYYFMYRSMFGFGKSLWVFVSTFFLHLLGFIFKHTVRVFFDSYGKIDSNSSDFCHGREHRIITQDSPYLVSNGGNENSEFFFGFNFQLGEDFKPKIAETESSVLTENGVTVSTSKYMFESAKDIGGFMEKPKVGSFIVEELFVGSNEESIDNQENQNSGVNIDEVFQELGVKEKVQEMVEGSDFPLKGREDCEESEKVGAVETGEKTEEFVKASSFGEDEGLKEKEGLVLRDQEVTKKEQVNWLADNFLNTENFGYGFGFLSEDEFAHFDSKLESDNSSDGFSISHGDVDSGDLEFFPDGDANEEVEGDISIIVDDIKVGFIYKVPSVEEIDGGEDDTDEDEFIEFDPKMDKLTQLNEENPVSKDCSRCEENDQTNEMEKTKKSWDFNHDEEDDSDALLEHEVLIEQMKMELKNLRTGGLPTILEEFETTKMMEGLKPLEIHEKLEHGDRMEEVQKFYKSYADKMRKLDVLNYQTLQAISFLQMKHPVQSTSVENSSFSAVKSLLLPNFWPSKLRRIYADPTLKSIAEMQRDLELVYVGQVCLSWEILRWQFGKAKELQECDPEGLRSYNQVAGEFQQFQVLAQRFTEDEPFQGPRTLNYVEKRCTLRSLLHVPPIRDDRLKDKKGKRREEEYSISMAMLADIIEESMRVFWEFLSADKNYANFILGPQSNLHDPADLEHFMDIKTSLQKKEKRLKDIMRTGNCLVKKFHKHHRSGRLDLTLFISQVELRLVSRVLSLPRLTRDQLIWCRTKLNNINFVDKKIHIEPLFLLFPC